MTARDIKIIFEEWKGGNLQSEYLCRGIEQAFGILGFIYTSKEFRESAILLSSKFRHPNHAILVFVFLSLCFWLDKAIGWII